MIKDFFICLLATLNLQIFVFLASNQAALAEVLNYSSQTHPVNFESLLASVQEDLIKKSSGNLHDQLVYESNGPVIVVDDVDASMASPYLSIPQLGVVVPVAFEPGSTLEKINQQLQRGVVSREAFPYAYDHQPTVVYGHSSDYPWLANPYASVFTLLPKLSTGDRFQLVYGSRSYWYEMKDAVITGPDLTPVYETASAASLVLTTCYPIGFNSQRYNVVAQRL